LVQPQPGGRRDLSLHPAGGRGMTAPPTVFVVDDDEALRDSVCTLLAAAGLRSEGYASAAEFLAGYRDAPGCVLLDVRMPGMGGLRLQDRLAELKLRTPL